jgi:hypothetical protein
MRGRVAPLGAALVLLALASSAAPRDCTMSVEAANRAFVTQWGPTPFNAAEPVFGYDDCGPAASVIALAVLGLIDEPGAGGASHAIDRVRDLERGEDTRCSAPTFLPMVRGGLEAAGASVTPIDPTVPAIREGLRDCGVVLVSGDPGDAWGRRLDAIGLYLHAYGADADADRFDHWVAIVGAAADGRLLVADPLSTLGVFPATDAQIETFSDDARLGRVAVSVRRPAGKEAGESVRRRAR